MVLCRFQRCLLLTPSLSSPNLSVALKLSVCFRAKLCKFASDFEGLAASKGNLHGKLVRHWTWPTRCFRLLDERILCGTGTSCWNETEFRLSSLSDWSVSIRSTNAARWSPMPLSTWSDELLKSHHQQLQAPGHCFTLTFKIVNYLFVN